jgi:hypothetical protein
LAAHMYRHLEQAAGLIEVHLALASQQIAGCRGLMWKVYQQQELCHLGPLPSGQPAPMFRVIHSQ